MPVASPVFSFLQSYSCTVSQILLCKEMVASVSPSWVNTAANRVNSCVVSRFPKVLATAVIAAVNWHGCKFVTSCSDRFYSHSIRQR